MNFPLVSVVIPNYNYARWVGEAVESVLSQTWKNLEVIVVDNGSTDDSLSVLAGFGNRIRVIAQENRGQAGSRNRGVEESRGEFVAFLDADDVWLPKKLEAQMAKFGDPAVGLVYCALKRVSSDLRERAVVVPSLEGDVLEHFALHAAAVIQGGESTAVVRRSVLERAGTFDARLSIATGWDMWRRIASLSLVAVVQEPLVLYRQHSTSASNRLDVFEHDMHLKLEKLFSDPASARVSHLRARSLAAHYFSFAGALFHGGRILAAAVYVLRSALHWPPALAWTILGPPRQTHTITHETA